ncbi:MAG TPA: lipoprotein-releasing system ATP-binding protein LolD [Blastocatellia bacterium]|nr:lipoprotein-releasing system ATP-binding protein LolD [Blastocatellia bacterium]
MSKVQSPKSKNAGPPDIGLSTLGFGLTVTDLRKAFQSPGGERIEVLRGISFSARPGETIAIVGASGAGKSTLLHLIGGIEAPDHGNIKLGDFAVESASRAELARFRNGQVGVVFQFHHLLSDLTAAENVCFPLMLARHDRRQAMRSALEALDRLGLASRASHRITDLSGGEQQRIAVCRALITAPLLVLADEPTGNLDSVSAALLETELMSYAASRPAIVIIATHNQDLARRCDRVLTLEQGRIVAD